MVELEPLCYLFFGDVILSATLDAEEAVDGIQDLFTLIFHSMRPFTAAENSLDIMFM